MKKLLSAIAIAMVTSTLFGQVGINTKDPEATFDIRGKNHLGPVTEKDGILVPRVSDLVTNGIINGQLVYLISDNASYIKGFYYWDGAKWSPLVNTDQTITNTNIPTVYARGRKTTTTTCTGSNSQNFSLGILSDPAKISSTGAITANKTGYYQFTVSIRQYFPAFTYSPIINAGTATNGLGQYSYTFRGAAQGSRAWNKNSYTGVVYLSAGESTPAIQWSIGGSDNCGSADRIGEQEVIWVFLGDDQ